jgi:hypothetical protein
LASNSSWVIECGLLGDFFCWLPSWSPLAVGGASVVAAGASLAVAGAARIGMQGLDSLEFEFEFELELEESSMMAFVLVSKKEQTKTERVFVGVRIKLTFFLCSPKNANLSFVDVVSHLPTDVIKTFAIFAFEREMVKRSRKCNWTVSLTKTW